MNGWWRWIGDWKRKTAHLSAEQKGIYGELLDHIYATEIPLPLDMDELYRIAGAQKESEFKATISVLERFFDKTENGYTNSKAVEEIAKDRSRRNTQRANAVSGWQKRKNGYEHPAVQSAPAVRVCSYCGKPSTGSANGYQHCAAHLHAALDGKAP